MLDGLKKKIQDSKIENLRELARQKEIVVLATTERMFPACGKLYANGLNGTKTAAGRR